ncbi:MAG: hypothetical protein KDA74_07825, partial [Planctomycetaceae bacterium]|nr:hypothetical protein [Planctomycetaceae bacterium]
MSRKSKKKQRLKKQAPPPEQMLLDFLPADWHSAQTLCFQSNLYPLTTALMKRVTETDQVDCFSFDKTIAQRIGHKCSLLQEEQEGAPAFNTICDSELPANDYEAVLLPLSEQFSDELARELTLSAAYALQTGGTLTIASSRTKDYEYHKF